MVASGSRFVPNETSSKWRRKLRLLMEKLKSRPSLNCVSISYSSRVRGAPVGAQSGGSGMPVAGWLSRPGPGWRGGDVGGEVDRVRADDARPFVWRVAPPGRVATGAEAGPFLAAGIGVLRDAGRL